MDDLFNASKTLVEGTLKKLGLDPEASRAKSAEGQATYTFGRGSAHVLVGIVKRAEQQMVYLRVASPVMIPGDDAERNHALFERLLELNGAGIGNCAFATIDGRVVVISERPAVGLDAAEVEQILKHTSAVADTYDDRLVEEFGGRRASDPTESGKS
ncbi:MAG: YbjN domain-containing protein [Polyangiaceae bacterium]